MDDETIRYWAAYRGDAEKLPADLDEYRRAGRQSSPEAVGKPTGPAPAYPAPQDFYPQDINAQGTFQAWLDAPKPGMEGTQNLWRGKKVLGSGGNGVVGLWEYESQDREALGTYPHQVAIKEAKHPDLSAGLSEEAGKHKYLLQASGEHLVRMIGQKQTIQPGDNMLQSDPAWSGKVGRLYLEYCPLKDLSELIHCRAMRTLPFKEASLWAMFECLIDGCLALETGTESQLMNPNGSYHRDRKFIVDGQGSGHEWRPICHFDLKVENIYLAERDAKHGRTPVCKIGDFGHAKFVDGDYAVHTGTIGQLKNWRLKGTAGCYAPEQFTERWDFDDWKETGVAGIYGSATNVFQIGHILWQMMRLTNAVVLPSTVFKPDWNLNNAPAKGLTYGRGIWRFTQYSELMRGTVLECLYEKPANRLTLWELKKRAVDGYRACVEEGVRLNQDIHEPWEQFVIPTTPIIDQPAPEPLSIPAAPVAAGGRGRGGRGGGTRGGAQVGGRGGIRRTRPRTRIDSNPPYKGGATKAIPAGKRLRNRHVL